MTVLAPIPVIATSRCYAPFLAAVRRNLMLGLQLARGLKDAEVEKQFQAILDTYDVEACDLHCLIDEANSNADWDRDGALADHIYETRRDARDNGCSL